MGSITLTQEDTKELLDAQAHIWTHIFYYLNSMALKCAIQLGILDTIHKHGKPMTLNELAISLPIHPNKASSLHRLMRILVTSKFFSIKTLDNGEKGFTLTLNSQLLLKDHPISLTPFALLQLEPIMTDCSNDLSSWFQKEVEESCFVLKNGVGLWKYACFEPKFNDQFNQAMESDSRFVTSLLLISSEFRDLFEGVETVVDVGGGIGTTAKAISEAYHWLKSWTVLELPHVVVEGSKNNVGKVKFVEGDMFDVIPCADVALLKWILHDWSDDDCVRILEQCKEAIPNKEQGGKVIIIDIVITPELENSKQSSPELFFDLLMMTIFGEGKERTQEEWKNLFVRAGFGDYKILPIVGSRSVIELYPS